MRKPSRRAIGLPSPRRRSEVSIEEVLAARRSVRSFSSRPLADVAVGQLLWSAQGMTEPSGGRAAPSAGALYPLEIYAALENGLWHYEPRRHRIRLVQESDVRGDLCRLALGQESLRSAPLTVVFSAVFERVAREYGPTRGERYVHMEAGHAAQNVLLQAVALGLAAVPIGAFHDARMRKVLGLPEDHEVLYMVPVGFPR